MNLYRFDDGETSDVVAVDARAAFHALVESDYLDEQFRGDSEEATIEWRKVEDDEVVTIGMEEDPDADDLAPADAKWDPEKRTLTMSARSWCSAYEKHAPYIIATSAC